MENCVPKKSVKKMYLFSIVLQLLLSQSSLIESGSKTPVKKAKGDRSKEKLPKAGARNCEKSKEEKLQKEEPILLWSITDSERR